MDHSNQALITFIIETMKALYTNKQKEISLKLKNMDYINIDVLVKKIEEEISPEEIPDNYEKIVSIIESIIQD